MCHNITCYPTHTLASVLFDLGSEAENSGGDRHFFGGGLGPGNLVSDGSHNFFANLFVD